MEIRVTDEVSGSTIQRKELVSLAETALRLEGASENAELSLAFLEKERMAELNRVYLGRSGPTDVLAFPMNEEADSGELLLGDVVVCPEEVAERREFYEVADGDETGYVMVHGILHLLGYEHDDEAGNREMDKRVLRILAEYKKGDE